MNRIYLMVAVTTVVSAALMFNACLSGQGEPEPFTIVWNYDTSGYLETCGCSTHQLGGLARRGTKIAQLRDKQPLLAIEGAHFMEDVGEFQLFKGEIIVKSLSAMKYSAMQIGVREAQHGPEGIDRLVSEASFPLFSANLQTANGPWKQPVVKVRIAGITVGITGVSQPELINFELPGGLSFSDPVAGLERAISQLRKKVDITIVCLEGNALWIAEMQRHFAGRVDLFLSGDRKKATANLDFSHNPPSLNNWKMGQYLGLVAVDPSPAGFNFAGMTVRLEDTIADAADIIYILDNDYKAQLKDRFFSKMKVDLEQLYLPPDSCEPCHSEAYEIYLRSGHARSKEVLVQKGQTYNPDCMTCHLVYDPDQAKLEPLNCVVCHSNITDQHIWDALDDKVVYPDPPVASYSYNFCVTCHDEQNSAGFKEYWPQFVFEIAHGGDTSVAAEAAHEMGLAKRIPELNL